MRRWIGGVVALLIWAGTAQAEAPWQILPPTPSLPATERSGYADVNGIKLWYAEFGQGQPVILLHGGFANSNYWGHQVPVLAAYFRVIVIDSRGHGRSGHDARPLSYDLMASDVLALMDSLKIDKAAVIGWSDGAIIGLDIAIHNPDRLTRLFAFGANSDPSGTKDDPNPIFPMMVKRSEAQYRALSPNPSDYKSFAEQLHRMWQSQPKFTAAQLRAIKLPVWIVDGDRDEVIRRENTEFMARTIPNAGLLIQPEVSHFSFMQKPQQFNDDLLNFLGNGEGRP
jgi:pimeloyl-ACP methyl ester carboxylesterase